jgi:hypothetical protein
MAYSSVSETFGHNAVRLHLVIKMAVVRVFILALVLYMSAAWDSDIDEICDVKYDNWFGEGLAYDFDEEK